MPDACDFIVDLQLKAADDFTRSRVMAIALIERIEDDCQDCGAIIPSHRRQALPTATRCLYCQDLAEAKGVQRAR